METKGKVVLTKEEHLYTRTISDMKKFEDILAYKIDTVYNGNVLATKQGLTTATELREYEKTGVFEGVFKYKLVDAKKFDENLKDRRNRHKINEAYIKDVYDCGIVIDKTKKHALIWNDLKNDKVTDYIGTYHAKCVVFDYIGTDVGINDGRITENVYDLDNLLEVLKKRDDIIFMDGPKKEFIPYYNATKKEKETINFIWTPKEEDYKKCLTSNNVFRAAMAPTMVFGVNILERK